MRDSFTFSIALLALFSTSILLTNLTSDAQAQSLLVDWTVQFGTNSLGDNGYSVDTDGSGHVYLSGTTYGDLVGANPANNDTDAFVARADATGTLSWIRQFGTGSAESSFGASVDNTGSVYVVGGTAGDLHGSSQGSTDAYVARYDALGNQQWIRQLGSSGFDVGLASAVDDLGSVYVAGHTTGKIDDMNFGSNDAFFAKYNSAGTLLWSRQFGSDDLDFGTGITVDIQGNIYLSGTTAGNLEGTSQGDWDVFITKYDPNGTSIWTRQIGTSSRDDSADVTVDLWGNVYLVGYTEGAMDASNAGNRDAFVTKFDSMGNQLWTRQLGSTARDEAFGVSINDAGNVFITGVTEGVVGNSSAGLADGFVSMYDTDGAFEWTMQFGTTEWDQSNEIAVDSNGVVYVVGATEGDLGGANTGNSDVFLRKLIVPTPGDFDLNGVVDGLDFLKWQVDGGTTADLTAWESAYPTSSIPGDFDLNGMVDGLDFLKWQRDGGTAAELIAWHDNYGLNFVLTTSSVPEPQTISLFCLALLLKTIRSFPWNDPSKRE